MNGRPVFKIKFTIPVAGMSDGGQHRLLPPIGTRLVAEYHGIRYKATVVKAKSLHAGGKQIRIDNGPAKGILCNSLTQAMHKATEEQRRKLNLGRKAMGTGWRFWLWEGKEE